MRGTKKIIAIAAAILVMSSTSVLAAENGAPSQKTMTVNGAGIHFRVSTSAADVATDKVNTSNDANKNNKIPLGQYTIDMSKDFDGVTHKEYFRLDDNRGTNSGWNIKVKAGDLVASVVDQSKNVWATVTIPARTVLTVKTPTNFSAYYSTKTEGISGLTPNVVTPVTAEGIELLAASVGHGAGIYENSVEYKFQLPKYLPTGATVQSNDSSSMIDTDHTAANEMGMFAGTYYTTIQYALTSNP